MLLRPRTDMPPEVLFFLATVGPSSPSAKLQKGESATNYNPHRVIKQICMDQDSINISSETSFLSILDSVFKS